MLGFGLVSGLELSVFFVYYAAAGVYVCMCICLYVWAYVHVCVCSHKTKIRRQCQERSIQTEPEEENISTADRKKVDLTKHKRLDRLDGKWDIYEMGDIAQL